MEEFKALRIKKDQKWQVYDEWITGKRQMCVSWLSDSPVVLVTEVTKVTSGNVRESVVYLLNSGKTESMDIQFAVFIQCKAKV